MAVPVRSCCFFFNLRQGSMLIAIIELLLSAIALFLLLLGSAHAQEMAAMLEADIEESEQNEHLFVVSDKDQAVVGLQPHHFNNQIRLHKAQHLALGLYCCFLLTLFNTSSLLIESS
ncbi:hypothetical protein PR048_004573 [Dryococelus australis]|uniref:Uncharacterized protein n=1 Tax=Dryococelus australis TaxID=614101 RepID=A0ABQ9I5S9_9NEOP|nr:hypothetical protein PR048_004573 [Dryococelus australis]